MRERERDRQRERDRERQRESGVRNERNLLPDTSPRLGQAGSFLLEYKEEISSHAQCMNNYTSKHRWIYIHTYMHTYIHTYIHIHIYIYMYSYIFWLYFHLYCQLKKEPVCECFDWLLWTSIHVRG